MSYQNIPNGVAVPGTRLQFPVTSVPPKIADFLQKRGWTEANREDPIGSYLFYMNINGESVYCSWSEAVAYEFFRFIDLGTT